MRHRIILLALALLVSPTVFAQSHPALDKSLHDEAVAPATAASAKVPELSSSDAGKHLPFRKDAESGPFKFKDQARSSVPDRPSPSANDKAAVMGTSRPWQDGNPPLDCASHPHSAGCQ